MHTNVSHGLSNSKSDTHRIGKLDMEEFTRMIIGGINHGSAVQGAGLFAVMDASATSGSPSLLAVQHDKRAATVPVGPGHNLSLGKPELP